MLRKSKAAKFSGESNLLHCFKIITYSSSKEMKQLFCFFVDDLREGSITRSSKAYRVAVSQLTNSSG
ncbi:hypothetical protein A7K93_09280 [Candidatus Methylacidiphilum fumarolicum]|nr:hypothetical protein A7K73_11065 [Candidatus Methylacidiphilum fumarolicum]TFE72282.1 hypothetical protein A7K93_09280 [Candidatus Methylacidiphilum fumarolicum]TFE72479.1 hypothetical protein A7K72_08475 [Candidatus Methylacidiphilum fumarolicum]TFE77653.1 hypothetical protein A7D33_03605 [Candidatus Methylacidiphilum fumarolicum]